MSDDKELTADEVLFILAHPQRFDFKFRVWYAINAPPPLIESHPESTLAGRLKGVSEDVLKGLLKAIGLGSCKLATWRSVLNAHRRHGNVEIYMQKANIGTRHVTFIAFGLSDAETPHNPEPKQQVTYGTLV